MTPAQAESVDVCIRYIRAEPHCRHVTPAQAEVRAGNWWFNRECFAAAWGRDGLRAFVAAVGSEVAQRAKDFAAAEYAAAAAPQRGVWSSD